MAFEAVDHIKASTKDGDNGKTAYLQINGMLSEVYTSTAAHAAVAYVTIGNTATLSAERALTAGSGIGITDGGAGSTVTIDAAGLVAVPYVTIGNTATTSAERALTAGAGITVTDGGVNSTVTIASKVVPKVGSFTRDTATATGTQSVTGVGFQPSAVIFFAAVNNGSRASWGVDIGDSAGGRVSDDHNTGADTWAVGTGATIFAESGGGNQYSGFISAFGADGFTVSWTRTGVPTGTLTIIYLAFR